MDHNGEQPFDDCMDMIEAYIAHEAKASPSGSKATPKGRGEIIRKLNRDLPFGVSRTCREELEDWLYGGCDTRGGRNVPWSQNTKATYYNAIVAAYEFWADPADPWVSDNPTVGMTPAHGVKGTARDCTDEDLWRILDKATDPYRRWALIAAYQGLRCIELSGLDREHITESRLIVVRGKGGKPRVHDTDPLVWQEVKDLPPGPVCRDMWGRERASTYYISRMASRHFREQLGVDVSMHMLRHWLGVRTQANYRDIRVTQEILGHESLAATQIYTKATAEQQRAARATLPRPRAG